MFGKVNLKIMIRNVEFRNVEFKKKRFFRSVLTRFDEEEKFWLTLQTPATLR